MPTTDALQQQINALTQRVDAITAPPTNYYTHRYSGEEIDNGVQGGLLLGIPSSKQQALRNIGGRPNRNLLDNWYFVGGGSQQGGGQFPINQHGETSWSVEGCHLDRWYEEQDVVGSIGEDGYHIGTGQIVIQGHSEEEMNQLLGKTVTISCLLSDGSFATATGTIPHELTENFNIVCYPKFGVQFMVALFYSAKSYQFGRFQNASGSEITAVACKTEFGPTQTLAYQDEDGNWQLFETPDYGEELAKCQRYLRELCGGSLYGILGVVIATSTTQGYLEVDISQRMRTIPAISYSGSFSVGASSTGATVTNIIVQRMTNQKIQFQVTVNSGLTPGSAYFLWVANDTTAKFLLSAEL